MMLFAELFGMGMSSFPWSACPSLNFYHADAIFVWPYNGKLRVLSIEQGVIKFWPKRPRVSLPLKDLVPNPPLHSFNTFWSSSWLSSYGCTGIPNSLWKFGSKLHL